MHGRCTKLFADMFYTLNKMLDILSQLFDEKWRGDDFYEHFSLGKYGESSQVNKIHYIKQKK